MPLLKRQKDKIMKRLYFPALLALLMGCFSATGIMAQQKPNIIFVLTDDMGYSDLSCYGNPVIMTPFLDSVARVGIRATNYVVSSPSCTPSRASLLTGRYASRYDLPDPIGPGSKRGLHDQEVTIAEMLKKAGYKTAMIGKWHLGDHKAYNYPTAQGFDSYFGMLYSHDYRAPYVKTDTTIKIFRGRTPVIIKPEDSLLTRLYTKEAITVLDAQKKDQPFFLYLAYNMPHLPIAYAASASFLREKRKTGGALGAVVEDLDSNLALIWQKLQAKGLLENTIFIFSSDNGPWIDFPDRCAQDGVTRRWHPGTKGVFRGSKGQSYEGGVREPFIMYWKNHLPPATLSNMISNLDILPTLAKWTGAELPQGRTLDGQDISSLLTGAIPARSYDHQPVFIVNHGKAEAVRTQDGWKYRRVPAQKSGSITATPEAGAEELFQLNADPAERTNVIKDYPEVAAKMKALFEAFPANTEN